MRLISQNARMLYHVLIAFAIENFDCWFYDYIFLYILLMLEFSVLFASVCSVCVCAFFYLFTPIAFQ